MEERLLIDMVTYYPVNLNTSYIYWSYYVSTTLRAGRNAFPAKRVPAVPIDRLLLLLQEGGNPFPVEPVPTGARFRQNAFPPPIQ